MEKSRRGARGESLDDAADVEDEAIEEDPLADEEVPADAAAATGGAARRGRSRKVNDGLSLRQPPAFDAAPVPSSSAWRTKCALCLNLIINLRSKV